ncbi:hypothetical protein GO491_09755 [Flavobacteriaceae bacterium Ap0902]|nr:hypothetical protein [Flavobacteriaceae bacterium Ap0902]
MKRIRKIAENTIMALFMFSLILFVSCNEDDDSIKKINLIEIDSVYNCSQSLLKPKNDFEELLLIQNLSFFNSNIDNGCEDLIDFEKYDLIVLKLYKTPEEYSLIRGGDGRFDLTVYLSRKEEEIESKIYGFLIEKDILEENPKINISYRY